MPTIAERIREGLALRGMKQSDLVQATGIGKSSISTYLSGSYIPKQRNIYKIAEALDVSVTWLMGYDVSMGREKPTPDTESGLSDKDIRIAKWFNSLPPETQKAILTLGDGPKDLAE